MIFWLFHIPNILLAAALYTLLGRYILSLFFRSESDKVIWRVFRQITDPVLRFVRYFTPAVVPDGFVMVLAIFWMIMLRIFLMLAAIQGGVVSKLGA
jgi:YggT family protein